MDVRTRSWWVAVAMLVLGILLSVPAAWFSPGSQIAIAAACATASLAVTALAIVRYQGSRNPHALFLAAAFGVIAIQSAWFGVWWPLRHGEGAMFAVTLGTNTGSYAPVRSIAGAAPVYAWQFGWLAAGACLILGVPWWDRRGRRPVRPAVVAGVTALAVVLIDLLLRAAYVRPPGPGTIVVVRQRIEPEALGWALGVGAAAVLAAAAVREMRHRGGGLHRWIGIAAAAATPLPLAAIRWPTFGMEYVQWADVLGLAVPAIAAAGLLSVQRAEASRMRRASDRADEVLGGRAEVAAMLAHEVRGPVASVKSLAATTLQSYDRLSDTERKEFVGLIEQESSRLLDTVTQSSLALKVDARTIAFDRRSVPIGDAVRVAVEATDTRGHAVDVDVPVDLRVAADPKWIVEALRQGLDNAAKYSPEGVPIGVRARGEGSSLIVEIVDSGPGVPPDQREKVFERFATWRPRGFEDRGGSGLGLFICRALIREQGGDAGLDEAPGGGTMLRITLPAEG